MYVFIFLFLFLDKLFDSPFYIHMLYEPTACCWVLMTSNPKLMSSSFIGSLVPILVIYEVYHKDKSIEHSVWIEL